MTDDFGPYADSIQGGAITFLKSARSVRRWETRRLLLDHIILQLGTGGGPGLTHGVTDPRYTTLLMRASEFDDGVWLDGAACKGSDLAVLPPQCRFIFVRSRAARWLSCAVRADTDLALRISPAPRHQSAFKTEKWLIGLPRQAALDFRKSVQKVFERDCASLAAKTAEETVHDAIEQLWASRAEIRELPDEEMRPSEGVVLRALDFAKSKLDQNLQIGDLAKAAGVGYRTLLRAFEKYLRVSPKQYLKLCTINSVYHALRRSDAPTAERRATLSDILAAHGVNEFGRFAGEYRSIFGEPPSATYHRHRVRPPPAAWRETGSLT